MIALLTNRALLSNRFTSLTHVVEDGVMAATFDLPFNVKSWGGLKEEPRKELESQMSSMRLVNSQCFGDGTSGSHLAEADLEAYFNGPVISFGTNCPLFRWISRNPLYTTKLKELGILPKEVTNVESYGFYTGVSIAKLFFSNS